MKKREILLIKENIIWCLISLILNPNKTRILHPKRFSYSKIELAEEGNCSVGVQVLLFCSIKENTPICEYVGELIDEEECQWRKNRKEGIFWNSLTNQEVLLC